jgi:predicted amidophosphoribosyltransferase
VLDLLLPRRCVVCRAPGGQLCLPCRSALPRIVPPLCERCGAPTVWPVSRCAECAGRRLSFASARAAVAYDVAVKRLVSGWKERGLRHLAVPAAEIMVERLLRPEADALVFVPPDGDRRLERGHHPAEALARELSRRWEVPVLPLIARARALPRQRGLSLAERRRNVRDAFRPARAAPPRACVVDDVYTSGATADAAAKALKRAGARRISVITFARAVR